MNCIICFKQLAGRQTKYCSRKCHNHSGNFKFQNYACQQERGKRKKEEAIILMGGCCADCGYRRNYAALIFHHTDPTQKDFGVDMRKFSNLRWESLLKELEKCVLLCQNCHMERHHPDLTR